MVYLTTNHPELAKYIHRLQIRVPLFVAPSTMDSSGMAKQIPQNSTLAGPQESHESSTVGIAEVGERAYELPQQRRSVGTSNTNLEEALCKHSRTIRKTLELVPNLCHMEDLTEPRATETGLIDVQLYRFSPLFMIGAHGTVPHMTGTVTSLRVREVVSISEFPTQLQHLDLDIGMLSIASMFSNTRSPGDELKKVREWRSTLKGLTQLRSLWLAFACGGDRAEEHTDEHPTVG